MRSHKQLLFRSVLFAASLCIAITAVPSAHADLVLTVTGSMTGDAFGYIPNQPATFSITISENTVFNSDNTNYYHWVQMPNPDGDPNLYSAVAGTGLTVTSPSLSFEEASDRSQGVGGFYFVDGTPYFHVLPTIAAVGPDGTTPITHISFSFFSNSFPFAPVTASLPTMYDYFKAIEGTYSIGDFSDARVILDQGVGGAFSNELAVQSLTVVSTSSVPEIDPAGFGSVAALVTGALGLLERRRKRA